MEQLTWDGVAMVGFQYPGKQSIVLFKETSNTSFKEATTST
jgi:hypothetical protein